MDTNPRHQLKRQGDGAAIKFHKCFLKYQGTRTKISVSANVEHVDIVGLVVQTPFQREEAKVDSAEVKVILLLP